MKIGIEGQRFFRKKKHGMEIVGIEFIRQIQKLDKDNEYFIFVRPDEDRCLQETANFKIIELSCDFFPFWEQYVLPKAVRKYGCDLLHCTSNTAPLYVSVPTILTLHDIIYLEQLNLFRGGTFYQKIGNLYRRFIVPSVIKNCKKIITVSKYERKKIIQFLKAENQNKVAYIYNGVGTNFKAELSISETGKIAEKYKLPDKFFLFLGNTAPKKNTKNTIKAYCDYCKSNGDAYKLVILDYNINQLKEVLTEINAIDMIANFYLCGYIHNNDMPVLYKLSCLFLYPSLRESFGLPILEAMSCGCPVITSNTSSMPEVADDAALIIDPFKSEDITEAIHKIISNEALKQKLIEKGYKRSKLFTWKRMAENVLKLYRETEVPKL